MLEPTPCSEWHVEFVDRNSAARVSFDVGAPDRTTAIAHARDELRFAWYDADGENIPEHADWAVARVESSARFDLTYGRDQPSATRAAEPPAEWEFELDDADAPSSNADAPTTAPPPDADAKAWNEFLAAEGLAVVRDDDHARQEHQLHQALELDSYRERHEQRSPSVRQPRSAVTIHRPGRFAAERYQDIRGDTAAIEDWLARDGRLEDYRRALRRGRPTAERAQIRRDLAGKVAELLEMRATATAIADVLDCGREAVSRLAQARASGA